MSLKARIAVAPAFTARSAASIPPSNLGSNGRLRGNQATGVYNILVKNMALTGVSQPLAISADDRSGEGSVAPEDDPPRPVTPTTPNIHDVTIQGLTATGATEQSVIVGPPEACIRNVIRSNVNITTSSAGLLLRNMTGTFTDVNATPKAGPPFVVQQNVAVKTAGTTPPIVTTPPSATTSPQLPCAT